MRQKKESTLNIRLDSQLRRKLAFLAETQNRGLSDFARVALEKVTAAAFRQLAAETDADNLPPVANPSEPPAAVV